MKNSYKKVAKIFGLKLRQKFTTNKRDGKLFMLTEEGLMRWDEKKRFLERRYHHIVKPF